MRLELEVLARLQAHGTMPLHRLLPLVNVPGQIGPASQGEWEGALAQGRVLVPSCCAASAAVLHCQSGIPGIPPLLTSLLSP